MAILRHALCIGVTTLLFVVNPSWAGPIHDAAKSGNLNALQLLIAQSANPRKAINEQDDKGYSALHWAVAEGKIELVPWLLKNEADVTLRTKDEKTPLLLAGEYGRPQTAVYLIEAGANVNDYAGNLETAVSLAARNGHPQVIKVLLERGALVNGLVDYPEQQVPLDLAVAGGHRDVVKFLVEKGSTTSNVVRVATERKDRNMMDFLFSLGVKPDAGSMALASEQGDTQLIEYLLSKGAQINGAAFYPAAHRKDSVFFRFLLSRARPSDILAYLRSLGGGYVLPDLALLKMANEYYSINESELPTLMHTAARLGHVDTVQYLISRGYTARGRDEFGNTALHRAAQGQEYVQQDQGERVSSHVEITRLLLDRGADVNARNDWGNTPLHRAVPAGDLAMVRLLVARGANVNAVNEPGATPLHMAALRGYLDIARLLVASKANLQARTERGTQPLHAAAAAAKPEMVKLLLENGANVNSQANHKMSPLHYALAGGYSFYRFGKEQTAAYHGFDPTFDHHVQNSTERLNTIRLLVSKGADVNAKTDWLATPLHLAVAGYDSLSPMERLHGYSGPLKKQEDRVVAIRNLLDAGADISRVRASVPALPAPLAMARNIHPKDEQLIRLLERADQASASRPAATTAPMSKPQKP